MARGIQTPIHTLVNFENPELDDLSQRMIYKLQRKAQNNQRHKTTN